MAIFEKINPRKSISLLLFYVAMALSIVYFDLFQSIEDNSKVVINTEHTELLIQESSISSTEKFELLNDQIVPEEVLEPKQQNVYQFLKRLFHDNRNLDHQFKQIEKIQFKINYHSYLQIALIISHQKMEEEGIKRIA